MRVATWNINGLKARLDFVLEWLEERQPDVVGFQELKMADDQFPSDTFKNAGYFALSHGQKAWNGVAILTKGEAECVQTGLPDQDEFGARLITAQSKGIRFTTVYCPNGKNLEHDDYPRKLAWFDSLREHLDATGDPKADEIICGDFNICPSDLDTWDAQSHIGGIFHTAAERQRMESVVEWGFSDLFRELHPDETAFTWWDYRGGAFHRKHGLRIDFILGTASIKDRLQSVTVDRDWRKKRGELKPSDHAPVYADLA
ncbi:MAG: exodeoxyribonuclease III [Deltaproteobacteria bacterium]|nr:exodeoxyribonuclease III [Deltaproteobacteria bacterium]